MTQKSFNVYTCKMTIDNLNSNVSFSKEQLVSFLDTIKTLPVNLTLSGNSRYRKNKSCLIFVDELKGAFKHSPDFLPAIFIRRRDSTPLEDDGHGNLQSVVLSSEENQIAEVCYVIFSLSNSVIYWINNPMVGGISSFASYLALIYRRACKLQSIENNILPETASIVMSYVKYPKTHSDYDNDLFLPTALDFNIALSKEDLEQGDLFSNGDGESIKLLREFRKNSNCGRIHLELSAPRYYPTKKTVSTRPFLNKKFILNFFSDVQYHLNEKDKFLIKGYGIDENTKVLDFIGERLVYSFEVNYGTKMLSVMDVLPKYESFIKQINTEIEIYLNGGES
ncbi:MAG: hypothetical protein J6K96_08625 [Treponema sp.]|nr:hypothetical protein [Treponema sp.]